MQVITVQTIAKQLNKSTSWVYKNAANLGAAFIGGSWIFTQEGLENAIQRGQEMAREHNASRNEIHENFPDQKRGNELGSNKEKRTQSKDQIRNELLGIVC
ncbi:MAG: hypothetical protein OEV64_01915 [Desulfobulbaceae bacterium]|nr:hypothetical protein [Desulfobulbaceae bacterium]